MNETTEHNYGDLEVGDDHVWIMRPGSREAVIALINRATHIRTVSFTLRVTHMPCYTMVFDGQSIVVTNSKGTRFDVTDITAMQLILLEALYILESEEV